MSKTAQKFIKYKHFEIWETNSIEWNKTYISLRLEIWFKAASVSFEDFIYIFYQNQKPPQFS